MYVPFSSNKGNWIPITLFNSLSCCIWPYVASPFSSRKMKSLVTLYNECPFHTWHMKEKRTILVAQLTQFSMFVTTVIFEYIVKRTIQNIDNSFTTSNTKSQFIAWNRAFRNAVFSWKANYVHKPYNRLHSFTQTLELVHIDDKK